MHLFYCDESNLEERDGDFLIYGGLVIDGACSLELSHEVDNIRAKADVDPTFKLKFNPGPPNLSHDHFLSLKQAVMEATVRHGVKLVVYVILHNIARSPDEARRNGINAVCYHFNCLLNRLGGPGLVLIDQFNDAGNQIRAHLDEKFAIGIRDLPYTPQLRLANIVGFHYSVVGQSHFPSLVDIALGSLRFAINAHTRGRDQHLNTAQRLLGILAPMFFREQEGAPISELSFQFSPKVITAPPYREKYQALKDFLTEAGVDTAQRITDQRMY